MKTRVSGARSGYDKGLYLTGSRWEDTIFSHQRPASPEARTPADLRILAAAEKLFAERGFHEISIQMLADAAGVNRALIFYHFGNKETLYRRLFETAYSAYTDQMKSELADHRSPPAALEAWIRMTCRSMGRSPDLLRLLLREVVSPGPVVLPVSASDADRTLREIIESGCRSGSFRPVDAAMTAISLMGLMAAFFRRRYVTGHEFDADVVADHVVSLVMEGLLATGPRL